MSKFIKLCLKSVTLKIDQPANSGAADVSRERGEHNVDHSEVFLGENLFGDHDLLDQQPVVRQQRYPEIL